MAAKRLRKTARCYAEATTEEGQENKSFVLKHQRKDNQEISAAAKQKPVGDSMPEKMNFGNARDFRAVLLFAFRRALLMGLRFSFLKL
jgi:hypothetical protein